MDRGTFYTLKFAAAVCLVCSVLVSGAAVVLGPRQQRNAQVDMKKKVLGVAGLLEAGRSMSADEIEALYDERIRARVIELESGAFADQIEAASFDPARAAKEANTSRPAPANTSGIQRLPHHTLVYFVEEGGQTGAVILPVQGKGLWSTLRGFLALEPDGATVRGIAFYSHGETPGLGGEIDNPRWQARWPGRKAVDSSGKPVLKVAKGAAGEPGRDPHQVDGISGATLTGNGVSHMLAFWLGPDAYGPFLERVRQGGLK